MIAALCAAVVLTATAILVAAGVVAV